MKLGILSDTHKKAGRAKKAIDLLAGEGAEFLIHAGDIGKEEVLVYMEATGLPYAAVLGNNDRALVPLTERYALFREPHYFTVGEISVKLMHHPWFLTPDADLVVYGHTHRFGMRCGEGGTLFLNPGEVCARNKPVSEAVLLDVEEGAWHVKHFQRRIKESAWHTEEHHCPKEPIKETIYA
ncbi:YfcE family phosphodiesterase [Hydrogenimonas sp. SS33]|uniref:metallophosphoesterase family protein n=1 Tax=Hydrogenimonas leucolamina TaxID=2954236 RepID=UPI00336BFCB3